METIIYKLYFIVGNYMKAYFKNIELVLGSDLTWYWKCPPMKKCYICMVNNVPCIDYGNSVCGFNPMQRKETCEICVFRKKCMACVRITKNRTIKTTRTWNGWILI